MSKINYDITTAVLIIDKSNNRALMLNRIKSWKGFAIFGGHIESGESLYDCAVREVYEESGLTVTNLIYKGLVNWEHLDTGLTEYIHCYVTYDFKGEILKETQEGSIHWVELDNIYSVGLSLYLDEQLEKLFFADGVCEMYYLTDNSENRLIKKEIRSMIVGG